MSNADNKPEEKPARKGSSRRGSISAVLALLLSLASVSLSAYLWYTLAYRNAELFNNSIPDQVENLRGELNKLQQLGQQNSQSIEDLGNSQKVLAEATQKAYSEISRNKNRWAVSEIEQLLIIANQRLQLAQDFETAAFALQAADARLSSLADPSLTPVRRQLAKEINELKSYERTDLSGLSLRLAGLIDNVEKLPLSLEVSIEKAPAKTGGKKEAGEKPGFFAELWQDIKGLVEMRSNVESYKPLLPPEQQYFLRENLRLLLLGAQQALLRNERDIYIHNLDAAKRWVNRYFDTHSQAIRQLNNELDALVKTKLVRKTPNISGSLSLLRKLTRDSGKQ